MTSGTDHWYALQCPTGREVQTRQLITGKYPDVRTLLPSREMLIRRNGKLVTEVRPLFPGYLILQYPYRLNHRKAAEIMCQIPNSERLFVRFLGMDYLADGNAWLREIDPHEISFILALCSMGETIGLSHFIKEGNQVRIIAGPLKGREAQLASLNLRKKRARFRLTLLGQEHLIDLGLDQVSLEQPI